MQKLLTCFSKNISIYAIFNDQSFKDTLTNDIVSLEELGISLPVLADSIYNILIFFAEKNVSTAKATHIFFSAKKFSIFPYHSM